MASGLVHDAKGNRHRETAPPEPYRSGRADGTTAVGAFDFDPNIDGTAAFTFAGGVYQIFTVPGSAFSLATGINGAGVIVGAYFDLTSVLHGFANDGGTFSNVDFPGATGTQVLGINDAGQMVGDYFDASGEHGSSAAAVP